MDGRFIDASRRSYVAIYHPEFPVSEMLRHVSLRRFPGIQFAAILAQGGSYVTYWNSEYVEFVTCEVRVYTYGAKLATLSELSVEIHPSRKGTTQELKR